jgi:phosphoenolpyruvate carboxylase
LVSNNTTDRQDLEKSRRQLATRRQKLETARNELNNTRHDWITNGETDCSEERRELSTTLMDINQNIINKKKSVVMALLQLYSIKRIDERSCSIVDIILPDNCAVIGQTLSSHLPQCA